MTREEAKTMFRIDIDSYGKPKAVMSKVNRIYDEFESRTCESCEWGMPIDNKDILLCGAAVCLGLDEYGQYVVTKGFGCNKWEEKHENF